MTMDRKYAFTLPQLVSQARAAGWSDTDLVALRRSYDLAVTLSAGYVKPHGESLLTHLTRTSSIVLAHDGSPALTKAALLHATYQQHRFRYGRRTMRPRTIDAEIDERAGTEVRDIVHAYEGVTWTMESLTDHVDGAAGASGANRGALVVRVANTLEDNLDGAHLYRKRSSLDVSSINASVVIAERLGMHDLAAEIRASQNPDTEVLAALVSPISSTYLIRQRVVLDATTARRVLLRVTPSPMRRLSRPLRRWIATMRSPKP